MKSPSLLVSSALLLIVSANAQNVLLPDNHHLGESQAQVFASGSNNWFGSAASTTGRRIQVLYDASHFLVVGGVNGAVIVSDLAFRAEDTEHNRGGQVLNNVTASIYSTSLSSTAALSTTFATNIGAGVSTLLSTVNLPSLTVAPAHGRAPNDYIISIPLAVGASLPYDPTVSGAGAQPNFLIDISYTSQSVGPAPELSNMPQIQDTAGTTAFIRGRGLYSANSASATGTASTLPPVVRVSFFGPGGYASLDPARNERYGAACGGSPSAFYQLFAHNEYFDLRDPNSAGLVGLRLQPDTYPNPSFYVVGPGAAPVDLINGVTGVPDNIQDDTTYVFQIPAFGYPGGPAGGTTVIRPSSNGYVVLDPTSTETASDFSPTVDEFLGVTSALNLARFCPFWHDFSPNKNTTIDPLSGQYARMNGTQVLVTWYRVGRFNSVAQQGQEYHTFQVMMDTATGVVEFRYGPMEEIWGDTFSTSTTTGGVNGITGFTRGRIGTTPSVNPQSRDLSIETPFLTAIEGAFGNMGNTVVATPVVQGPNYMGRAFYGQALTWNASNVPAGTILGAQLLDIAASRPGLQLPFLTAPGCMLSVTPSAILWEWTLLPPANVTGTIPFSIPAAGYPGFLGFDLYAQYVSLDGLFLPPGSPLITVASNAVRTTIGLQ
jgi:hypothetical protein